MSEEEKREIWFSEINELCKRCSHQCKQSHLSKIIICPHYEAKKEKKRMKKEETRSKD